MASKLPPAISSSASSSQTSVTKDKPKIGKLTKYFLGLSFMAVFTNITIMVCNYYNIPQVDYFLYLLWMYVLIIFFMVLPGKVDVKDFY